jgi:hypothetical protein
MNGSSRRATLDTVGDEIFAAVLATAAAARTKSEALATRVRAKPTRRVSRRTRCLPIVA